MPEEPFTPTTGVFATDKMVRDWLRKPFKPEQIGKLPATQKRPALDFVGHAAVTDRLNKIAPDWSYTVDAITREHTADSQVDGVARGKFWIRGTMTIGGVSRPEFGDGDDPKEAIGNFIRRGAMRFGVAIDLWSREELEASPAAGPHGGVATKGDSEGKQTGSATAPGRITEPTGRPLPAGDTQSAGGEAADVGAGGGSQTLPGVTIVSPGGCDHKFKTGRWLPTNQKGGVPVCPRCGMSALLYRESA